MISICDAIHILSPESRVIVRDESLNKITWTTGNPKGITKEQIQAKLAELQAEYVAQEYARSRKVEYDALNQFELISDDTKNGTTTHIDAIAAIKAKYPKPE